MDPRPTFRLYPPAPRTKTNRMKDKEAKLPIIVTKPRSRTSKVKDIHGSPLPAIPPPPL